MSCPEKRTLAEKIEITSKSGKIYIKFRFKKNDGKPNVLEK